MAIVWSRRSYTKDQFIQAWNSAEVVSDVIFDLYNTRKSGRYRITLEETAKELGLTKEHMLDSLTVAGRRVSAKKTKPLDELLVKGVLFSSTSLKKKLWDANLLPKQCQRCGITEWMGVEAPLALDHINGEHTDNRLENLRILCYNCHGQTETYCGKNHKK